MRQLTGLITPAVIDLLCPEHGRTSCSDDNICNASGGWSGRFDPDTGKKVWWIPRCSRCYLLDNLGRNFEDLELEVNVNVYLEPK